MQMRAVGKNPNNYESLQKETSIYEQKPINIDDFNDLEEAEVKERVNKQKQKRCEITENNKLLKKKKKRARKIKLKKRTRGSALLS